MRSVKQNRINGTNAKGTLRPRYTVIIQWSDEDDCYVVSLPEWGKSCKTHGSTYEEAARNADEVLEMLIGAHEVDKDGPLPKPKPFRFPGATVMNLSGGAPAPTGFEMAK